MKEYEEWRMKVANYKSSNMFYPSNPIYNKTYTAFELPFLESFVHLKVAATRSGGGGLIRPSQYTLSSPNRTKKAADILEEIKSLTPADSVFYYQRKIQKRVLSKDFTHSYLVGDDSGGNSLVSGTINKKILLFEEESEENSYFGILNLSEEEFKILSMELPMSEELKDYDWNKLDEV